MRTALRTSIVTAALAGALLAPAATAIAAPTAQAATAVTSVSAVSAVSGTTSGNDRYDGEKVLVADNHLAVLRNGPEGPEAWIRSSGPNWKPGDAWAFRVLGMVDLANPRAVVDGIQYDLKKVDSGPDQGRYLLNVYVLGEGASKGWYLLPKAAPAAKPSTKPAPKPSAKPTTQPAVKPAATPANAAKPQTVVVPQGPVAAGAELADITDTPSEDLASEDTDNTTTAATGTALVAILAALGAGFVIRNRKARTRG